MYQKRECNYVMVPMEPTGKYKVDKILYIKEYFSTSILKKFQVMDGDTIIIEQAEFPIPIGYKEILRKTYKNCETQPKDFSYWVLELDREDEENRMNDNIEKWWISGKTAGIIKKKFYTILQKIWF